MPKSYRALGLDLEPMVQLMATAPTEFPQEATRVNASTELILSLPVPDGGFERFRIVDSPIMAPELASKFPQIRTYRGQSLDRAATARLDITPQGFHAMILAPEGQIYIDPYRGSSDKSQTDIYMSYFARDARAPSSGSNGNGQGEERTFSCGVKHGHDTSDLVADYRRHRAEARKGGSGGNGTELRTYRLAVAATGEYTAFHGGTVLAGQAAIVTAMNRVNGIYEQEVAIRMVLIANNDQLVYTNAATDPYNNDNGPVMLGQNQNNVDNVIGSTNYDVGHVFSTGGGGIAALGAPCRAGLKAQGVTGLPAPTGDPFWVDFVAHELGHQWAGNHTFNGNVGNCEGGNRNGSTAYEPGSGSTIQAYAGICGSQNLQLNSDPFFHGISLDEVIAYSTVGLGSGCAAVTATGNDPPTADAGDAYTIPVSTPFELCGSGSDPNSDPLTFSWEQFDLGNAGAPDAPVGNAPIFRSFSPTASPCRTFPRLADLAAGELVLGELLPTYARTMNFRLTARDNRSGGGGVNDDSTTVTVVDSAGPFQVTAPNTPTSLGEGATTTVTWDVASTDQAPVSCGTVDISLSTDGGATFPTVLADGVANSGSQLVTLPNMSVSQARVQVRCATNIFFDISDANFGIGVPIIAISAPTGGAMVEDGDPVTFTALASDPEDGDLSSSVVWTSSIQGQIGTGGSFTRSNLELGLHTITADVQDSGGNGATVEITLEVRPRCVTLGYDAGYETTNGGWINGASTCSTGTFVRGTPDEVLSGGVTTQPAGAASGSFAWFTADNSGGVGTEDVDDGTCETLSPVVNVGAGNRVATFVEYFHGQRDAGDDSEDGFSIELLDSDTNAVIATLVNIGDVSSDAVWTDVWNQLDDAPENVRLRIRATDGTSDGDLVEGGVDEVRICFGPNEDIFEDDFETGDTSDWTTSFP